MLTKIDLRDVLTDHLATLTVGGSDRRSIGDLVLFFGAPAVLAIASVALNLCISEAAGSLLINALAIFAALLLNVLLLIHGLLRRYSDPVAHKLPRKLLRQLYANIAYAILASLVALLPLIANALLTNLSGRRILAGIIIFLVANFLLTLLMVLKQVHILLRREYEQPGQGVQGGSG